MISFITMPIMYVNIELSYVFATTEVCVYSFQLFPITRLNQGFLLTIQMAFNSKSLIKWAVKDVLKCAKFGDVNVDVSISN